MTEKLEEIDEKEWLNKKSVRKFVHENNGWYAILGNRNPSRLEIARLPLHADQGGGAFDSFGAEAMDCLLPWFIDLYNDSVRHHNNGTSCHCRNNPRWQINYASRKTDKTEQNAESALKSMQEIIKGIEEGTLVIPDYSKKS
ncbi:hypothetical protein KY338_06740 [Candidatus Woesearchaeota archaeon]|nr:hypothetical protein [Candidatus Woesearchaeota archaeon]MBW3005577.1 hypothetical protein [Candidatus Woesearchaeota archaeon]